MAKFIIVDTANLFFRCIHVAKGDAFTKSGLALHIMLRSIKKIWNEHRADHVVFCLEGKSWRNAVYPQYKMARKVARNLASKAEQEEMEVLIHSLDTMVEFLRTQTNVTVLQNEIIEGDDFVGRWVQNHPLDEHIIVSGDSDFLQLMAPNVVLYDGVRDLLISKDGITDEDGDSVEFTIAGSNAKLKVGKKVKDGETFTPDDKWWEWALFLKCIRGDSGDSIFSAYPKVRETKIRAAWEDRAVKSFDWNNLMQQEWVDGKDDDGDDVKAKVSERYLRNELLIDLTKQPDEIKELMDSVIAEQKMKERKGMVGLSFMKFCKTMELINIGKEAEKHATYLNAPYKSNAV